VSGSAGILLDMSDRYGMGRPDDDGQVAALVTYLEGLPVSTYQQPEHTTAGAYVEALLGEAVVERPWTWCSNLNAWVGGATMVFRLPPGAASGWAVMFTRDVDNPDDGEHPWLHLYGTGPRLDRALEWAHQSRTAETLPLLALSLTSEILRHEEEFLTFSDSLNHRPLIWALSHVLDRIPEVERTAVRSLMALRHGPVAVAELARILECAATLVENQPHTDDIRPMLAQASVSVTGSEMSELALDDLCLGEALMRTPRSQWNEASVTLLAQALREKADWKAQREADRASARQPRLFSPAVV
jgi:hypothetical protein